MSQSAEAGAPWRVATWLKHGLAGGVRFAEARLNRNVGDGLLATLGAESVAPGAVGCVQRDAHVSGAVNLSSSSPPGIPSGCSCFPYP